MLWMLALLLIYPLAGAPAAAQTEESAQDNNAVRLDEMVVSATKIEQDTMDVPFFVSTVTRKDFEKMGARTLVEALRSIPGLQIGTQGNAYPHIEVRGFRDTKDLAVLIDGVPFRQINGSADLTMIPLSIVERIEFVKGPGSSIWGRGAVAGTLNIITKPADTSRMQAKVQAGGGSWNTFEAGVRGVLPYEKGYAMLNLGASTSDGFQDETGRDASNALFSLNHRFGGMFSLDVQGLFSKVDANRGSTVPLINGEPAYGVESSDNFGVEGAKYQGEYKGLTVSPQLELAPGLVIKDVATVATFDKYATGGITIAPSTRTKSWWESDSSQTSLQNDLSLTWQQDFGKAHNNFLMGFYVETAEQESFSPSFSKASTYGPPDWETPRSNTGNGPKGIRGSTKRSDYNQTILSFYIQDQVEYGPFGFIAGARYDNFDEELSQSTTSVNSSQTDSAWSPRVGANWKFLQSQDTVATLFANYVEGFRTQFPSLSTKNGVTLPQLRDPEKTKSYEGGVKVSTLGGRLFGQASIFQTEKDGPRSYRTSSDDFVFTNARTQVTGLETELRYNPSQMWSLWAHYSYHDAHHLEFSNSIGHSFAGFRLRMSPRHIAGVGANFAYKNFNWNVTANYVGDRNLRDNTLGPIQNLPSYTLLNTAISYTFMERYEIQFVVNNIADEYYIADDFSSQEAGCAGEPRSFFVWLRTSF